MKLFHMVLFGLLVFAAGCGSSDVDHKSNSTGSQYVLSIEPVGAIPVGEARKTIKDNQTVTLVGTIGGSSEPFVDGLAAFTIVDSKVPYCAAEEGCPTPWDYCCTQDQVKENIATVKLVDEAGNPIADEAQKLLGVKELSTVVVEGKAKRDAQGNLTISTNQVFVRTGN